MENPPAPDERARLGPLNPLSIAVAVVLLAAGGAFGWRMRSDAPSARPTAEVAAAALALERIEAQPMCRDGGMQDLRDAVLDGPEAEAPERLAAHLPKRSPIPGYERVAVRAADPTSDADYVLGAVDGHVASFRPEGQGGFDVYAFRFLTPKGAGDAVAANVVRRVCHSGAVPLTARGRPGLVVVEERDPAEWSSAWWVTQSDVIVVRYGGWGDERTDRANLAAIAGAAALF